MATIRDSDGSQRQARLVGPADVPHLGVDGSDLTFICIDHQARLQFADTEVAIGTSFQLVTNDVEWTLDPEEREHLGPLLAIYPTSLISAVVEPNLTLRLKFEGGGKIDVPQHPYCEAWQVSGPGSRLIVCPPEGDGTLAVWT